MRGNDKEEVYCQRWDDNPFGIVNQIMPCQDTSWAVWHNDLPCAIVGAAQTRPGVFSIFMFATEDFSKIALSMARFLKKTAIPALWTVAHRIETSTHINRVEAHAWLRLLGCEQEGVSKGFGRDGSDFIRWYLPKPPELDKPDTSVVG